MIAGRKAGNAAADTFNNSSALVSENDGARRQPIDLRHLQVRMTDAAGDDADQYLVVARRIERDRFDWHRE